MPAPVKRLAEAEGLPLLQPRRLRAADLAGVDADLMIVVAYGQILKAEVLDFPRLGCINVHASLLPRWRGAAPVQRAILAGDTKTGVCIMQMDEGLDTGAVLDRKEVAIAPSDTAGSLTEKLARAGCEALLTTLDGLEAATLSPEPQPEEGVTWADKIGKAEAQLRWTDDAAQLERCVRAFDPDPGAYTFMDGMRIKVWQAKAIDVTTTDKPGRIVAFSKEGIEVACGRGHLLVRKLQLPVGKGKVVSAADLLNGRHDEFGPGNNFDVAPHSDA